MFKVSKPEMVNKIYLYDDKMTVLYNTQDSHSDVTIDDLSSSRVVLVEHLKPTMNTLRSWSGHPQAPPRSRPAECHQL